MGVRPSKPDAGQIPLKTGLPKVLRGNSDIGHPNSAQIAESPFQNWNEGGCDGPKFELAGKISGGPGSSGTTHRKGLFDPSTPLTCPGDADIGFVSSSPPFFIDIFLADLREGGQNRPPQCKWRGL